MFARSQAMKKPYGVNFSTDAQDMILKQRQVHEITFYNLKICSIKSHLLALISCSIDEIMGNELWQSDIGNPVSSMHSPLHGQKWTDVIGRFLTAFISAQDGVPALSLESSENIRY
jgi:hypothetical protein